MATVVSTLPTLPLALQAVTGDPILTYPAADLRYLICAMYPRSGKVGDATSLWIFPKQAGADWSIDINPGQAIVGGASSFEKYLVTVLTRTNVPLTGFNTAPTATRTHKVWLVVDDKNTAPGAGYAARIVITEDTGSGAANPSYPFYFQLGSFTITTGQSNVNTANITILYNRGDQKPAIGTLTLASGYTALAGGQPPSWSIKGNTVFLQGGVSITTPLAAGSGPVNFCTALPSAIWPQYNRYFPAIVTNGANTGRVVVSTAGNLTITASPFNTTSMTSFALDGMNYEIN